MKVRLLFFIFCTLSVQIASADHPKYEFRATWLTGNGIDWPKSHNVAQQKESLCKIFDVMAKGNMNAACLQVRSFSDAMYKSSYEPWSASLTGTRGGDPGYDPLAFAIEEAHKRGIELHVWVNPFRVTSSGVLDTTDLVWKNAGQWIIKYNNSSFQGQIIDPGYPEARNYVHNVCMEIINNYDIDGIVMDDYFYAYGGTYSEDATSKAL
ncbi:MAG: family 10 glycosylhydrolase, partial [Paludibacteraceae bacterium]|nr:family 10 glycosylhydrolase [Paludibacteraceae bacterium]